MSGLSDRHRRPGGHRHILARPGRASRWQRAGRAVAAAGAGGVLSALLAGLPWALLAIAGDPATRLPGPGSQSGVTPVQQVIAVSGWLLWTLFVLSLAAETTAAARGILAPRLPGLAPVQALAGALIAMLLAAPAAATTSPACTLPARRAAAAAAVLPADRQAVATVTIRAGDRRYLYRVRRGDTLWDIAAAWLGDPLRWPQIYQLNRARYDQHGAMHGGRLILPGWQLILPADARPPTSSSANPQPKPPASPTPRPAHTSSPTSTPHPPHSSAPPAPPSPPEAPAGSARPGAGIGSIGWAELGLAAALLAAAARIRARRRRTRSRRAGPRRDGPAQPGLAQPGRDSLPAALPATIRTPRRGDRPNSQPQPQPVPVTAPPELVRPATTAGLLPPTEDWQVAGPPDPIVPATHPAADQPPGWPAAGLGLTGPAAEHAARGFIIAALTAQTEDPPASRPRVLTTAAVLTRLLGPYPAGAADATPRLHVAADIGQALAILEQAVLQRSRTLYHHDADALATLRPNDPEAGTRPPLLIIAEAADPQARPRLSAVLAQGERLDIHGVLLGAWPDGQTLHVNPDGTTQPADLPTHHHRPGTRISEPLAVLNVDTAADLLRTTLGTDTGDDHCAPVATEPGAPSTPDSNTPPISTLWVRASKMDLSMVEFPDDRQASDHATHPSPHTAKTLDTRHAITREQADPTTPQAGTSPPAVARIRVLGASPQILDIPADLTARLPLRAKARELLAYLAAHPRGATIEALYDDVLADARVSQARTLLNTYTSNLRANLRAAAGPGTFVLRPKDSPRCRLDPDRIDCDLWRMNNHLHHAETATTPHDKATALQAAISEYSGPFADGHDYDWAEPICHAIHRQAITAHTTLATLLAEHDRAQAIDVLEAAIGHDPYNETLYRHAMRLHAADANTDAIHRLHTDLTNQLSNIQTQPSPETITLAHQLTSTIPNEPRPTNGPGVNDGGQA